MEIEISGTKIFQRNLESRAEIVINRGGTRSSKSYSILQLIIFKALSEKKKRFLFLRKTFPALRLSSLPDFRGIIADLGLYPYIKEEKQEHNFWVNGNLIHFDSLDDPQKKKSSKWNYIIFEEFTDFFLTDFLTMRLYLSADPGDGMNQIFCPFNPIDENHWIKTELIDKKNFDVEEIVSTWRDNVQNLHPQVVKYIQDLIKQDENFNSGYNFYGISGDRTLNHDTYIY